MSEIIRIGRADLGLSTVSPAREKIDLALSRIEKPRKPIEVQRQVTASEVIDLPRICAVHDRPYMSRYIDHGNGRITYARSIKVVETIREQYSSYANNLVAFPNGSYCEETCPWCGAEGYASILCEDCHAEICYGKTDASGNFSCRNSCGAKGRLRTDSTIRNGVRPSLPSNTKRGAR